MHWDLKVLTIPMRILKAKLNLFHHISCLPEQALARQVLEVQQRLHLGGLHVEVSEFLARHGVTDVRQFSKFQWKKFVSEKIDTDNREFLIKWSESYKKVDSLSLGVEEYESKPYFNTLNLAQARLKFRERSSCMKFCRTHASSDAGNIKALFQCFNCPKIDVLSHWRTCQSYAKLRNNRNLDSDVDLLAYYQDIIQLRSAKVEK